MSPHSSDFTLPIEISDWNISNVNIFKDISLVSYHHICQHHLHQYSAEAAAITDVSVMMVMMVMVMMMVMVVMMMIMDAMEMIMLVSHAKQPHPPTI